jgi:hypothetical protein
MTHARMTSIGFLFAALAAGSLAGCYESTGSDQPQAQNQAPEKQGPLTDAATGSGSGNSALGGAKRVAGNIAAQAEDASKKTAEQADHQMEEH